MGSSRVFMVCLLVVSLLAAQVVESRPGVSEMGKGRSLLQTIECNSACAARCRLSSTPNLCKRACGTGCYRCNCVPPGTYGNKQMCPCYTNMTTSGGRLKCP